MIIHGQFLKSNEELYFFNVYAPCDSSAKQVLWDSLSTILHLLRIKKVCVDEDLNVVRCREERRSVIEGLSVSDLLLLISSYMIMCYLICRCVGINLHGLRVIVG